MLEKGRITYKQLILLIALSRIIITITFLPALAEPPANQDIWLSELLYFPLQLLFALPIYFLWKRFPDQTIIQYCQSIGGKLGKLSGILILWYFLDQAAITIAQFSLFLTSAVMPETPVLFFTLSFVLVCAYATGRGLEVIGRLSELFAPLVMIATITVFLLLAKDMNLKMLRPVLENGILPITQGSLIYSARSLEILGFSMLLPYLNNPQKAKSVIVLSFALVTLFFTLITVPVLTIWGFEEAKGLTFPFYSVIRLISIGDFIERNQSIHMAIWILGTFIKVTFKYYLVVLSLGQLLHLKEYRPLILPTGTILIPLSLLVGPNLTTLAAFTSYKTFAWYSSFFILVIPSLLLFTAIIRKKGVQSP
ncbi:GerAB/ArcD/ProY family transporter [Desulfitobacterium metallireducens]|uniref:Spore germination protein n=1 Tax=Desulfitobacterium metallireducens DSM 15288 TaxID=871968 RepID=W0E9C4_9FIRM|nr:endospore germination permease [Desulfitobacterium metallireducens]AHF05814.1 spore germination protein [Desulfitobacterium metallireducens DSM 15288]